MCKFKVGDEVEILPLEELKKQAYPNGYDSLYFPYCTFRLNSKMIPNCGKKTKIVEAFTEYEIVAKELIDCYKVEIDGGEWTWVEKWLRKI